MSELISQVITRIRVADLDSALPTYSALAGSEAELRLLEFPEFRMAAVGPFHLLEGTPESLAAFGWSATLIVTDVDAAVDAFTGAGGQVVDGPTETPGGTRAIVKDRDGNLFECFRRTSS